MSTNTETKVAKLRVLIHSALELLQEIEHECELELLENPTEVQRAAVKLLPNTVLRSKRPVVLSTRGPKQRLLNLVPTTGISCSSLLEAAEDKGITNAKAKKWLPSMVKLGYISIG